MKKDIVTIYLRSGQTIEVVCDDWTFEKDDLTSFSSYTFEGLLDGHYISLDVKEIVGYYVKPLVENYL